MRGGTRPPLAALLAFALFLQTPLHFPTNANAAGYPNMSAGPTLLHTTNKEVRVTYLSRLPKSTVIVKGLEEGASVDFYMEGQLLCWTDNVLETIKCISHNGTQASDKATNHPTFSLSGLNSPIGLAVDWYTQKLYWADRDIFDTHRIEVCSFTTKVRKTLFWSDIDQPRAIAVAPMKGLLFWTDWGEEAKIERGGMDGKSRKVIVDSLIFWPNGLTIDYENNKLYWLDAKLHFIDSMDFDGKNRKTIMKNELDYGFALTIFNDKLYWTDWKTWYVHSWDMRTNGPMKDLIHTDDAPGDVKVWNSYRQPQPAQPHPCYYNNGNCSHLCLLSPIPPGYSCACPAGVKLLNKWQCANGIQSQLIIVQKMALSRISLDSPDYPSFIIPLQNIKSAVAVDYDSASDFIYWTDDEARTISRSRINGSEQSIVIQGDLGTIDGLAIDSVAGNLYWTDPAADTITTSRLDGSSRKVLINENLDSPRGIAVAPSLGWMFWSDWSAPAKIERAALDGSDRVLLISSDILWPNGIALDITTKKIYWGDAQSKKMEVCNMDGSDRRELIGDNLNHIFGLSLLGDYLYWTDWQTRSLSRVHKITGTRETVADQVHNVMGVKAFKFGEPLVLNPCSDNNGNCSHLCFNRPKDYICDCPIGLELGRDSKTCVKPAAFLIYSRKEKIGRLSIENQNNNATLPIKDIKGPSYLTIHAEEGRLYWGDPKAYSIGRCAINGSNSEKLLEWTPVESLALDWCGRNLYWIDTSSRIEVLKLDGSSRRTLIWQGLRKPRSIVLDPLKGYMYWSEWGSKSIKRAQMDGSHAETLMYLVGRAYSLTIDYELENLIWVTLEPPLVETAKLNGENRKTLISSKITMPFALTLYQDYIYWADWYTGDIESALKTTGENRSIIHSHLDSITEMIVYHQSRQVGKNPCSLNNGGCSHLCLSVVVDSEHRSGYKCACPTHYTLNRDNTTCSAPKEFILFSSRFGVGRVIIGGPDCPDTTLSDLRGVRAIEYDPLFKNLYWIEGRTHSIKYMSENGIGNVTVLTVDVDISADMALDPIGRALYFSSPSTNSINVTKLDNTSLVGVVIQGEKYVPKYIVIHPTKRLLFWADVNLKKIMSSAMDGSDRKEIIPAPNISALTLDPFNNTIYWANAKQIYACSLDGHDKRTIWQGGVVTSLSVLNSTLFWIDGTKQLMHLPLNEKNAPALPVTRVPYVGDVVAVHKIDMKHQCAGGGKCSGVCLAGGKCGCVRGLSSQGSPCGFSPCTADYFECAPNSPAHTVHLSQFQQCVPKTWRCDGISDCPNGADENGCNTCPANKFKCPDGKCLENDLVCDGIKQCSDGHDESNCCNGPHNYKCPNTDICILSSKLCEQWDRCEGADEVPVQCIPDSIDSPVTNMKILYIFILLGLVLLVFPTLGILYCRRKLAANRFPPDDRAGDPLSPKQLPHNIKVGTVCPSTSSNSRAIKMGNKIMEGMRMSNLNSSSTSSYDRNHITGASSSATNGSCFVGGRYPQEPLNPPPSPATTAPSSSAASRHRPYRHYRAINQPPPPTPCSTDVCDESESYEHIFYPMLGSGMYLEAPPPTPCPTSPPSPSSRSSAYFSPLPPPPSPVPPHYDS